MSVRGPVVPSDIPGLCTRLRTIVVTTGATVLACDVAEVQPDAAGVDALAHLHLAARRCGCHLAPLGASADLRRLIAFLGLHETLLS